MQVAEALSRRCRLDIVLISAGITRDSTLRRMECTQSDAVLSFSLDSVLKLCIHAAEPTMRQGYRRMISVSFITGQTGQFGQINRAIARAGVQRFSIALAREVAAKCVTLHSVAPHYRVTPSVQTIPSPIREERLQASLFGRIAQLNWIAHGAAFLAGEGSSYIMAALVARIGGLFIGL